MDIGDIDFHLNAFQTHLDLAVLLQSSGELVLHVVLCCLGSSGGALLLCAGCHGQGQHKGQHKSKNSFGVHWCVLLFK